MLWPLVLLGCGPEGLLAPSPSDPSISAIRVEDSVVYTSVVSVRRGAPKRYTDAWPEETEEMWRGRNPVGDHWSHQICENQGDGRARFEEALEVASAAEVSLHPLGSLVWGWCWEPDYCDWVVKNLEEGGSSRELYLWYEALESCRDPDLEDWFVREDAPWSAVVDWFSRQGELGRPSAHPALEQSLVQVIERDGHLAGGLSALGAVDRPASADALLRLYRTVQPASDVRRQEIALAMHLQTREDARSAFLNACDQAPDLSRCQHPPPLEDLKAAVRLEPEGLLLAYPDHAAAILDALHACVDEGLYDGDQTVTVDRCLRVAAGHDRAMAASWLAPYDEAALGDLDEALELKRYPDRAQLHADLVSWGLLEPSAVPSGRNAAEILEEAGVLWTPVYYGNHVHMAREMASRVGGLDDVVFGIWSPELVPPPDPDDETDDEGADAPRESRYLLRAYMDGSRHQVLLDGEMDVDLVRVGGFVNTLLETRAQKQRVVVVDGGDRVLFGVPEHSQRAIDAGLFVPVVMPWDPDGEAY